MEDVSRCRRVGADAARADRAAGCAENERGELDGFAKIEEVVGLGIRRNGERPLGETPLSILNPGSVY